MLLKTYRLVKMDTSIQTKPMVDFLFYGYVVGLVSELGYFYLKELETAKQGLTGIKATPIERDADFKPHKLSDIKKLHGIS